MGAVPPIPNVCRPPLANLIARISGAPPEFEDQGQKTARTCFPAQRRHDEQSAMSSFLPAMSLVLLHVLALRRCVVGNLSQRNVVIKGLMGALVNVDWRFGIVYE